MTNEEIRAFFADHAEDGYQKFTSGLIQGEDVILGVRLPVIRQLAKKLVKEDWRAYLFDAQDGTYEETILQGFVIGYAKGDIDEMLSYAGAFMRKIHNWSVSDSFCAAFKIAGKYRAEVWDFLMKYRNSEEEFEQRVVAVMLMDHFLTEEYIGRVLEVWDSLKHEGYYCKMGVAWGIATAYAKFPEETHAFLLSNHLDDFTYNKALRKMRESLRITEEQKELLGKMKRK